MKTSVIFLSLSLFLVFTEKSISQLPSGKGKNQKSQSVSVDTTKVDSNLNKLKIDGSMPNRISMNVTVPKQTQGATFGEKVNAGLQSAGSVLAQGTKLVSISGVLWVDEAQLPAVVNSVSAVSSLSGAGSGAASASYAATGRVLKPEQKEEGFTTKMFYRESSSGQSSGKRQHLPLHFDSKNNACADCPLTFKSASFSRTPTLDNDSKNNVLPVDDLNCVGIDNINVLLINTVTAEVISQIQTTSCGGFSFSNIPIGTYTIKLIGGYLTKKGYEYYMAKSMDMKGSVLQNKDSFKLLLALNEEVNAERGVVKTKTKSNQSNDRVSQNNDESYIVKLAHFYTDVDKDGAAELLIGGALPGGAILSSALNTSNNSPVSGLNVKAINQKSGVEINKTSNTLGEYEFSNLEAGNYQFIIDQKVIFNTEVQVTLSNSTKSKHDTVKNTIQNVR